MCRSGSCQKRVHHQARQQLNAQITLDLQSSWQQVVTQPAPKVETKLRRESTAERSWRRCRIMRRISSILAPEH